MLGLIASQAVLLDLGSGGLPLRLGSVVVGRIQRRLRGFHGTLGAGHLRPSSHVVERDE